MVITGIGDNVPDCVSDPLTTGVDVGLNPLAKITIVSPGWVGCCTRIERGWPDQAPFRWTAVLRRGDGLSGVDLIRHGDLADNPVVGRVH
jgi:hypothetical protein